MPELPELEWVYSLFTQGLLFGAGLGAVVWVVGYSISSIYKILRK